MTAEKTGFECCVEERMREHEERIRLREMKTARKEAGIRRLPAERVRESEERARLRELRRQPCGAETRAGHPCQRKGLGRGGRCANHGGPAQGRRPLRVVSGLPRRSAGVGTLAQPANADLVLRVTALFMPTLSPMAIKGEVDLIISTVSLPSSATTSRCLSGSTAIWSIRPATALSGIVASRTRGGLRRSTASAAVAEPPRRAVRKKAQPSGLMLHIALNP